MITLGWDATRRVWIGSAELAPGQLIAVRIAPPSDDKLEALRKWARRLFDLVVAKERELRLQIARNKLPLYNRSWRDDEPELSENEFADRIQIYSMVIYEPGQGMLFYRDGDLFAGHSLVASVGERLDVTGVDLFG